MFEINELNLTEVHDFVFYMNDFYKNPDEIINSLNLNAPSIHKWNTKNSKNTIDFIDCRHNLQSDDFKKTEIELYKFFKRDPAKAKGQVTTNYLKFIEKPPYENNYWWPHVDDCLYNCIVYLNKNGCDGTNLYNQYKENIYDEHVNPWVPKENYELLFNITSKYNRLVVFPSNIYHGLACNNEKFLSKFRKNQIIFIS
jgi:hypothetical protein